MAKWFTIALASLVAIIGSAPLWQHTRQPQHIEYALINETDRHDFDLAFRMSLKLAEKKSGIENALVLLPALPPGKSIEETAAELFSKLRIGARRNGRGILYLYSAKENLLKIEVSYALEGDIPDLFCRRLEEAAKTYMLSEVPQDFVSELIITTNLRGMGSRDQAGPMTRPKWLNAEFLSGGAGALVHGYGRTLEDYERAIRHLPDAQLNEFMASTDATTTVQRYLLSLERGIGDPRLPLLTEGSRVFRAVVPRDEAQQRRIFEFLQAAAPHRLLYANGLALVVPQPGKSNLPVVLRRGTDGLWYVDEPKAWTYFHRFEDDVNFYLKYADNPFLPELRALRIPNMDRAIYGDHARTPARPGYPFKLTEMVQALEERTRVAPNDAAGYAALGNLYLFEMNWITKAIAAYEKAEALAPNELEYRWRLMDLYLNASRADKSLEELKFLSEHLRNDKQTRDWYEFYRKEYDFGG
ncbi:MAG TPA: TPM domain-containing protein [Burkholderiales bacterium]|nr:TPM domain-containing protein [Burkholderiales bacterium]